MGYLTDQVEKEGPITSVWCGLRRLTLAPLLLAFLAIGPGITRLCAAEPAADTVTDSRYRFRIEAAAPDTAARIADLARGCATGANRLFSLDRIPNEYIVVRVVDESVPAVVAAGTDLTVSTATPLSVVTHALGRAVLLRYAKSVAETAIPAPEHFDWLAAAVVFEVLACTSHPDNAQPEPDYQPARVLFQDGTYPRLAELVTSPILPAPAREAVYRLYALHCHLLLRAVAAGPPRDRDRLRQLVQLLAHGREPIVALQFVLGASLNDGRGLQRWYEREAPRVSRQGRRQARADEVLARLRMLETVPMVMPGQEDFGCERVPIDEVPKTLKSYALDREALQAKLHNLFELVKDAPVLLQEPLADYIDAFQALERGRTFTFKRRLRKARKRFRKAMTRQRAVEACLDHWDRKARLPAQQFTLYRDAVRRAQERQRALAPELYRYLDELDP